MEKFRALADRNSGTRFATRVEFLFLCLCSSAISELKQLREPGRRVPIESIFAEGGATAAELVRRMNWPRLEVRYEWATGVATLAVADENTRWLTIKPGSYSWPDEWTNSQ